MSSEATIVIETAENPQHVLIALHGLGSSGDDLATIVPMLPVGIPMRYIFPHAPMQAISINESNEKLRAWYDVYGLTADSEQDKAGIYASEESIKAIIDEQISAGIKPENIIIAGFSQGGAMALHTGLRYDKPLAAIVALSTYLPIAETLADDRHAANHDIAIFMAHGAQDQTIPLEFAELSKQVLLEHGYDVDYRTYDIGHSVDFMQLFELAAWLQQTLKLNPLESKA